MSKCMLCIFPFKKWSIGGYNSQFSFTDKVFFLKKLKITKLFLKATQIIIFHYNEDVIFYTKLLQMLYSQTKYLF